MLLDAFSAPTLFAIGGGLGAATGLLGALSPRLRRL
jgi:hypothetical protein